MSDACQDQCASSGLGKLVKLEDAAGLILAHDITEIRPGEKKGPAFKKGYQVKKEDLEHLARLGKRHLFMLEIAPDEMHEDEAAHAISQAVAGSGVVPGGPPSEGKIVFKAEFDGLLDINLDALVEFNMVPDMSLSTIHRRSPVRRGQDLGATRAIPLIVGRDLVEEACGVAKKAGGILRVKPFLPLKTGVVVTGNEVFEGLIEDRFADIITAKMQDLGASVLGVRYAPDERDLVCEAILDLLGQGAELIITTAGMSVDPDDVTRLGIADAGGMNLLYGSPVLPGAMFLVGTLLNGEREVPILGVPACALFYKATMLDAVLPRVLAGESFTRRDIAEMSHGGYCRQCPGGCRFPDCGFGRGA